APLAPVANWLEELDNWSRTSPGFFVGRPIILDLAAVALEQAGIGQLIASLSERGIRIVGLEGIEPERLCPSLPPVLKGGRQSAVEAAEPGWDGAPKVVAMASQRQGSAQASAQVSNSEPSSLLLESPIRSGQSIIFPAGDVTVLGAVASGAEVVAGGSIHVYGALRGRAMAGSMGNARARIFCTPNEAHLISVEGDFQTAEEMDPNLRGRPTQCWLEDRVLSITALD